MTCHFLVNKTDSYTIELRKINWWSSEYKLFALRYPPDPHGNGPSVHHLYESGEICVAAGHAPQTVERAKAIAMHWCENWSNYVRTGSFSNTGKRINVRS